MTFLGLEARTDLPKVSYPTALDFFVFLSFAFIFATILQFAVVHYFTKYGSGEFYFNFQEDSSSEDEDVCSHISSHVRSCELSFEQIESVDIIPLSAFELSDDERESSSGASKSLRKFMRKYFFCLTSSKRREETPSRPYRNQIESEVSSISQSTSQCRSARRRHERQCLKNRNFNSVSKIDKFSRVAFPLLFFIINVLYWIFYLTRSQRK